MEHKTLGVSAAQSGMDEKTARKYMRADKVPSEMKSEHRWRTRDDPFESVWNEVKPFLEVNDGLEAKTLFEHFQRRYPGTFTDGQLRTFQRKVRQWRALEGPPKEVFFAQQHHPGRLAQSDFTHMNELGVSIAGVPFNHLIYHFVLTYSNWEAGSICFSESLESLSDGFQQAVWRLGGVPHTHRTDRMSAAVHKPGSLGEFTAGYSALMDHYAVSAEKTQACSPNENGDVEQRHHRFKRALEQALLLRGSRDFADRETYAAFVAKLFDQLNAGRSERLEAERGELRALPARRLDSGRKIGPIRVSSGSLIRVKNNTYSVDSRLIGEHVRVRLYAQYLEIWYANKCLERIPRLRGEGKHALNYRHVIDTLLKKPGAFANYRYRGDMFPTSRFRKAYDELSAAHSASVAAKEYLLVLARAAGEGEARVDAALTALMASGQTVNRHTVDEYLQAHTEATDVCDVEIASVDVAVYDALLELQYA